MSTRQPIVPVVLSGGMGTRLWPASRHDQPKQLLPLVEKRTMIRATVDRASALTATSRPIIVTNASHADAIEREMALSGHSDAILVLEPVGRNTAPAVALAAHEITAGGHDGLMVVLPSDHAIADEAVFTNAIEQATAAAEADYLVTFGITPSRPETGYGYIRVGTPINADVAEVAEFREKPDRATAETYVESGNYLWNSGMFLFLASRYLDELQFHAPDIADAARSAYTSAARVGSQIILDREAFARCPSDSIDYAVMERTSRAAVVPTDPGWSDVGSWASLWDIGEKDADGNVISGDVEIVNVSDSYIRAEHRLVAAVGIDDVVIVDTPDALLVTTREHAQDVKEIADRLKAEGRREYTSHDD